jgi:hypothetical protein
VCWHLVNSGQDYAYARPSLVARKRRTLELRAGARSARGVLLRRFGLFGGIQ